MIEVKNQQLQGEFTLFTKEYNIKKCILYLNISYKIHNAVVLASYNKKHNRI